MSATNSSGTGSSQSSHSHSEVGHIKNVANFNILISTCLGFGASYNPTNPAITTTAMQALFASADAAVTNSMGLGNTLQQTINARVNAFADVKHKASRIIAALIACGADAQTIKNAQTINRKIQGRRAKAIDDAAGGNTTPITPPVSTIGTPVTEKPSSPPPTTLPVHISVSQQSYDRLVSNLSALINYASQVSTYNPNETDLKIAALNAYLITLQSANNTVISAHVNYNNAVITRTKVLYDSLTGLVHIALEVKQYINSVYGAASMQAKQVKHINFRTLLKQVRKKHN